MATRRIGLTKKHYVPFDAHIAAESTLTAYGKLIEGGESTPTALGISHPMGLNSALHKSLVFGVQIDGQCIKLPNPEEVALPDPDGPADGCGWDPSEFAVWKNLPRNWTTLHFQSQPKPLVNALSLGIGGISQAAEPTVDDVLHQWLSQSVPGQPIPNVDQLQVAWKDLGSGGAFTVQVQQNLANLLNNAFAPDPAIVAANLPGTLTVGQLKLNLNRPA